MIVINSPHNPTGAHFTQDEFTAIVDFAREHDLWLFSDEMYRFSEHDEKYRLPAACDVYEKAVSLSGSIKIICTTGITGRMVSHTERNCHAAFHPLQRLHNHL